MRRQVQLRPAAERDIDQQVDYLAMESSPKMAIRFHEAIEKALQMLAQQPELGSPYRSSNPRLQGLRFWPVRGISEHVIFYRDLPESVEVLRVLHGKRDLDAILADP